MKRQQNLPTELRFVMGNEAIARGAVEAGVRVVAGYPGTPASEILTSFVAYPQVYVEWSTNETVALELVQGASLCNQRSMAVMKHNGTNTVTDFLMHLNFTGVRGGLVLISADDPGGNSSQNEEDTRILTHIVCAPAGLRSIAHSQEAKAMVRTAFELSESTELCFVLRPVMRVCHSRSMVDFEHASGAEPSSGIRQRPLALRDERGGREERRRADAPGGPPPLAEPEAAWSWRRWSKTLPV